MVLFFVFFLLYFVLIGSSFTFITFSDADAVRSRRILPACKENLKGELFPSRLWMSKVVSHSSLRRLCELRPQKITLLINVSISNYFKLDHASLLCPELIQCYIKWFHDGGFNLRNSRCCCQKNICGIMLRDWKRIYLTITSNPVVCIYFQFLSYFLSF